MKILVTGAQGFIGKNLIAELKNRKFNDIYEYDLGSTNEELDNYCKDTDFVFHLAGVNRPLNNDEFMQGNFGFTNTLLDYLEKNNNKCPIMISSSIQAELDNPYGLSKRAGENLLLDYSKKNSSKVFIYRFPNVFGKWSRPNYNSAVATFCYNISRDLPITISNPENMINLVYIDDVVSELINLLENHKYTSETYLQVPLSFKVSLKELTETIYQFKESRKSLEVPDLSDEFTKRLYSTYLSFLSEDNFGYNLKMNIDDRGSFTEILKSEERGQVSVNISKPGITKGNHWHHTKNEKFLVVSGNGVIRFRNIFSNKVIEYFVSGQELKVIDIPPGYTHNITNLGDSDMVTVMWANEKFDPDRPDTFYLEV